MSAPDYSQITDQRLRVSVAEQMGWTDITVSAWIGKPPDTGKRDIRCIIPNYPASLDAGAELDAALKKDVKLYLAFAGHLEDVCGGNLDALYATARQRCLAYLLTVAPGKLKEI